MVWDVYSVISSVNPFYRYKYDVCTRHREMSPVKREGPGPPPSRQDSDLVRVSYPKPASPSKAFHVTENRLQVLNALKSIKT